ncbi:MAG TPA: TetR/AcrR family transcriptional regulator [Candidatus Marinimicrobia bacterium]|nr:TetR/AcrR family transcriptional regulator [Candidatus Neomarinimicrobiota bacterium]HRS52067.1 TetR/AcrR family transcriptional regulator [Candidatus Neomarinimicrobiota bacterium]HRU93071.1 TetR/AcrR family transcriptional regulator [Candidatus Neomarinimicrobiota bacterium]
MRCDNVTREKILKTAARLFADKGFEATSMREIAESCELTKPALYYYFQDKNTLFTEIINAIADYSVKFLTEIYQSEKDPVSKLYDIAIMQVTGIKRIPEITKFLINAPIRNIPNETKIEFVKQMKKNREMLVNIINDGKEKGYFKSDLDVDAFLHCYLGGVNQFIMWHIKQGTEELSEQKAKIIVSILLDGIRNY